MLLRILVLDQRAPQQIRAAPRHSRESVGDQQNVLFERHQAVGVGQQRRERGMNERHRLQPLMPPRECALLALVRRAGTNDRLDGGQAIDVAAVDMTRRFVIAGDSMWKTPRALPVAMASQVGASHQSSRSRSGGGWPLSRTLACASRKHTETGLPQQVHLEQPELLDIVHGVVRGQQALGAFKERHPVVDGEPLMTRPQGCMAKCRGMPSKRPDIASTVL